MKSRIGYFTALLIFLTACNEKAAPPASSLEPAKAALLSEAQPDAQNLDSKAPSGMSKIIPEKRVPIVGGCSLKCTHAESSVKNFLRALLRSKESHFSQEHDQEKNPMLFVNTQSLQVNGQNHTLEWHKLWTEGRFKERVDKIHSWLKRLRTPLHDVRQNTDVETLINEGVRPDPKQAYVFHFMAPGLNAPWSITAKKRGVEWLVNSLSHKD